MAASASDVARRLQDGLRKVVVGQDDTIFALLLALLGQGHTEPLVTFNGEHFLDQRARRPVARIVNGVTTELTWPLRTDRAGHERGPR